MDESDRIAGLLRLHARAIITGRELVNAAYDEIAHDQRLDLVPSVTATLIERDEASVSKWVDWIEDVCRAGSDWRPFHIGPSGSRSEEYHERMRANFRQVAAAVRAVLAEPRPGTAAGTIE